jgi:hypothetical protein
MGGLEASGGIALEYFFIVDAFVEIVAFNYFGFEFLVLVEEFLDLLFYGLGGNNL